MNDPQVVQFYLSVAIAIIMLGMGLALTINDFKRIKEQPKGVFIGLVNQLLFLPLIGLLLVFVLKLEKEFAVGIILVAACPGGATSNLITNLAKGDLGLSITLTALSSVITVFTIPLIVNAALSHYMGAEESIHLDFWDTFLKMVMITLVPVSIGMFVRSKNVLFANKMERPVKIISVLFMALIIIGAVLKNKAILATALPDIGPAVIGLNVITMLIGFLSGKLLQLDLKQRISISIESGIQNASLALFIGSLGVMATFPSILLGPAIYGVLMFFTGGIFAAMYARMVK